MSLKPYALCACTLGAACPLTGAPLQPSECRMESSTVRVGCAAVLYLPTGDTRAQCPPALASSAAIVLQACHRFQASREACAQPSYTVFVLITCYDLV